jgi:hypothetical protein
LLPLSSEPSVFSSVLLSKNVNIKIYKITILRVILNGCETRSLTLREEHRLRVLENMPRGIFGPKRDKIIGDWTRLHNEELHNLYSSPNIIRTIKSRKMRWAVYVARMEKRNAYKVLWESQKRPPGRPRCRREDNIM